MNDLLSKLDRRQLTVIGGGLLLLLVVVLLLYVVQPQVKGFLGARSSLTLLTERTENGVGLDEQLGDLRTEVDVLERELHGDMANLPMKQMEAFIIGRLQGISWRNDVRLIGVEPTDGGLAGEFSELLFNVELHGRYLDMFAWLESTKDELGFVVIKQFEMTPVSEAGTEEPELRVNLTMASYRRVEA
ncbi:MAG: hypothetical protein ACR2QQ_06470 [Gammaproteobacteria bacterium]